MITQSQRSLEPAFHPSACSENTQSSSARISDKNESIANFCLQFERAGIGLTAHIIRFHFQADITYQHFAIRRKCVKALWHPA